MDAPTPASPYRTTILFGALAGLALLAWTILMIALPDLPALLALEGAVMAFVVAAGVALARAGHHAEASSGGS